MHELSNTEIVLQSKYILRSLQRADEALAAGIALDQVCQLLGISIGEYLIWRRASASTCIAMMAQLESLGEENRRLRNLVADQFTKIAALENQSRAPVAQAEGSCV